MNEQTMKQQIKAAYAEPKAPEGLIRSVILRVNAAKMGAQAQSDLKTASPEKYPELVSLALIGQLAAVTALPEGAEPGQLARQLRQQPQYARVMQGGNIPQRLASGELFRQLTQTAASRQEEAPQMSAPQKQGPVM